jgi:chemotaxis protein MotB
MARKKRPEKHANHERWLVSYADFITLLFAFFVVMYSISRVDADKFGKAINSIHRAMGTVVPMNMPMGAPGFFNQAQDASAPEMSKDPKLLENKFALERSLKEMQSDPALANVSKGLRVTSDERGMVISFPDACLFEPCSEKLKDDAKPVLDQVGAVLLRMSSPVRVEGHTDPSTCSAWPSNWELSTARASNVIRYLLGRFNFNPARLTAAGYASYRPVDNNDTEGGRARNRRVDIVILSPTAQAQEPGNGGLATPIATSVRK